MEAFGNRIRKLREQHGMRQDELAMELGLSTVWLSKIECGHRDPSWRVVQQIARIFGVSLDYLAGKPARNAVKV